MALLVAQPLPGPGNILFPIGFVLIMMVVAALVAAAGDRMGHRAARRKLRIGKLRPRHVSTLIAVITGMLIVLVTVLVIFLVWHDFYNALTQYDYLNGALARSQAELDKTQQDVAAAKSELDTAKQQIAAQGEELKQKSAAITETRGKLSTAQGQLAKNQATLAGLKSQQEAARRRLAQVESQYKEISEKKQGDEIQLGSMRDLRDKLRGEIESYQGQIDALEQQIAQAEVGERLIAVGAELGVARVSAAQAGQIESILSDKLTALKLDLAKRGLDFDPASRDRLEEFLRGFTPQPGVDYLVVIQAAENVFTGGQVLLGFDARPLEPVVHAGEVVLDILIGPSTARITGLGGVTREVPVPAQFDDQSLIEFAVDAQQVFTAGARAAGFIADPQTGEMDSPVDKLVDVAGELASRPRPLRIQFVAKSDATPVDSLANASLYLSNPSSAQTEKVIAPESNAGEGDTNTDTNADTDTSADENTSNDPGGPPPPGGDGAGAGTGGQ